MSDQTFAGMIARWRSASEPGKPIGSKGACKYDIQNECADEAQAIETRLRGLQSKWRAESVLEHDQIADERRTESGWIVLKECADALEAILGPQAPERTSR
jgi:hypothetical protein